MVQRTKIQPAFFAHFPHNGMIYRIPMCDASAVCKLGGFIRKNPNLFSIGEIAQAGGVSRRPAAVFVRLCLLVVRVIKECDDLAAGAIIVGSEQSVANDLGHTVGRRPGDRFGEVAVGRDVGELRRARCDRGRWQRTVRSRQ